MHYAEFDPPPVLAPYVRCIWRLSGAPDAGTPPEPIVPDACAELVLNLAAPFVRHTERGAHRQPCRLVAGQISRAITIQPSGRVDLWGVRFHPWSAAAFFGFCGAEMRDQLASLDDVAASLERELSHVADARTDAAQRGAIVGALTRHLSRARRFDERMPRLIAYVAAHAEVLSVRGLADRVGMGVRRVEGLFREEVGLSPKQTLRIHRFQRALALRRADQSLTWGTIAARAGYYDQAHLNHDAIDIAGAAPSQLLGELTAAFLAE